MQEMQQVGKNVSNKSSKEQGKFCCKELSKKLRHKSRKDLCNKAGKQAWKKARKNSINQKGTRQKSSKELHKKVGKIYTKWTKTVPEIY